MPKPNAPLPGQFPSSIDYDIVIVGGGPVGGLTACALAQAGLTVAVVEAADPALLARPGTDGRAIAIALSAQRVFAGCGVWPLMAAEAEPILEIRVTDGAAPVFLHYDHAAIGDEPFGWMVENTTIRRAVHHRLAELASSQVPGARVLAPARVVAVERHATHASVTLADGRELRAALVVAADGRASATRQGAGIGVQVFPYHQSGIVCTVAHAKPHDGIAHERFLPSGPFAILPMTGNRSSIVWTERLHLADTIVGQNDADFLAELETRFGEFLGPIALSGPRFHYPLTLHIAARAIDRRLALVGDAAHGMHPVAGQGMNMGIRDVAALAEAVVDCRRLGLDIGGPDVLERYQRWRRFDTLLMLGLTDALVRLFSNEIAPLKLARDLGLAAVQAMPSMKRVFMKHAMGVVGDLPRMMRGEAL